MDKAFSLIFLVILMFTRSKCDISIIEDTGKSLKVAYNDVVIICHNCGDTENELVPLMKVGVGSFDASENLGNWIVNDTEISNIGLDLYTYGESMLNFLDK